MKIYNKVVIDMVSGDVIEEDSFEYDGAIAECKGGSSQTKTEYVQSPEQRQVFAEVLPIIQEMAAQRGEVLWDVAAGMPTVPTPLTAQGVMTGVETPSAVGVTPGMGGVLTGLAPYEIPEAVMPSSGWFEGIAPEVRAGLWEPYKEAGMGLTEQMASMGQLGSARAGVSAGAGAALGELSAQAATDVGLQAWQMTAPQLMQRRQELLERGMLEREQLQQERVADWESLVKETAFDFQSDVEQTARLRQERLADYQMGLAMQEAQYNLALEGWQREQAARQLPYTMLPGLAGGTYSTPVVSQAGSGFSYSGAAGGALSGAMAGSMLGPWGMAGGALLGAFAGGSSK